MTSPGKNPSAFAEIIIPLALPKNYTWSVPEDMQLTPGSRVEVNLGKNKKYAGIVKRIHHEQPALFEPKPILNILDAEPVVSEEQLALWEWMAAYYMCSEGEVMAAALPAHFKLSSETVVIYNEEAGDDFSMLDHDEYLVAEALLLKKQLNLHEVQQVLDSSHVYPVISRLIQKKICFVWEKLKQTYAAKKESYVVLNKEYHDEDKLAELLNNWSRAPKQMELLLAFLHLMKTEGEVTKSALLTKAGASDAQLKGLVEKNILTIEKRSIDRIRYLPAEINIDFKLTTEQQLALDEIRKGLEEKNTCLLHGVTGSGKTLLYVKLIEEIITEGKQVLYLLPEIALTSQIIRRLQKHFGGFIGVYHSKFNQNERIEIWNKVKSGELKVLLGARSSVFLPFNDLGLVICDEEHDSSYKQHDPAPRYNGRDAAVFLASLSHAKVILGTATPALESYYNAVNGKYSLVKINNRFGDLKLPSIVVVDTKKVERKDRNKVMITAELKNGITETISKGKKVILFQNRRGYDPYQICNTCGWIPQCKYCDVSLTFHKSSNKLQCHYCGNVYPPVHVCALCGNHHFIQKNFGTEKIEEAIQEHFPNAKIARMDIDSVRGKHAHDALIQQFEQGRTDILVGTQMVVKGLDFDDVGLVGIPDADGILHFTDFRVNERAFQLMEQVSGRAGRKVEAGKVIIQTASPAHPVLQYVKHHDYVSMYEDEVAKRKQYSYPPFTRLIHLTFRHKFKPVVEEAALKFAQAISIKYRNYMVGPAEPVVNRIRNLFLQELLLKLPRDTKLIQQCKHDLLEQVAILHQDKRLRSVVIVADVDRL